MANEELEKLGEKNEKQVPDKHKMKLFLLALSQVIMFFCIVKECFRILYKYTLILQFLFQRDIMKML
jgi:hypothetical protein